MVNFTIYKGVAPETLEKITFKTDADIGTIQAWCDARGYEFGGLFLAPAHWKTAYAYISPEQMTKDIQDAQPPGESDAHEYKVGTVLKSWREKHPYIANTRRAYELFYGAVDLLKETYAQSKKPVRKQIRRRLADVMQIDEKEAKKVLKGE